MIEKCHLICQLYVYCSLTSPRAQKQSQERNLRNDIQLKSLEILMFDSNITRVMFI